MDESGKRCRTICGKETARCFITNARHLDCITDIVINRVWAAREIIKTAAGEDRCAEIAELLNTATDEMDELIAWVKISRP